MTLADIANDITMLSALAGIIMIAYSGFMLITTRDPAMKNQWKEVILGVVIGLCIVFMAPWLASVFSGGTYCG
ncbi:TrbC/VirB2 family protein [Candidatus Micrarchaeota archaeon]|nr:TrbC/VirB2 family protein [Candidatus Micrarchaeota archaeon]MBI5227842.1 TrbC/VirB2 family protein [Candidatus Micrarchaeota archaeon]